MEKAKAAGMIALVAVVIFFVNLGEAKLWDRDEPRNAGCAKEMLDRGNLVTPIFNDELRDAKPVMLYWLMMSAYQIFGVNEFAARFWSAALAVGTVLCTFFIAQRIFDRRTAILSSVILATSLMFGVAARAATPDSALIFCSTAALAIFVAYAFPGAASATPQKPIPLANAFPRSISMAVAMYGLMALGVLVKGPIGFLMPTAIIGMYLLVVTLPPQSVTNPKNGRLLSFKHWIIGCIRPFHPWHFLKTCFGMRLFVATLVVLVVAGPWYYLVGVQTDGDFLRTFFFKEHLGRSTTSFENHSGSVFYYPLVMALGFFPWSVFALPVLVSLIQTRSMSPAMIFLICWVAVQVGIFSIVQTKLPSYVTPCYPALAILCGYFLASWARRSVDIADWIPRISFATLGIGGVATIVGMSYAAVSLVNTTILIGVVGLFPLVASFVALYYWTSSSNQSQKDWAVNCLSISAIAFSGLFFGWVLPQVSRQQQYEEILTPIIARTKLETEKDRPVGSFACLEPTWVFYGGQTIYELVEKRKQLSELDGREKDWKPKPRPGLEQFLVEQNGQVITREALVPQIENAIGRPVSIVSRSSYFMRKGNLVLIELDRDSLLSQSDKPAASRLAERPAGDPLK